MALLGRVSECPLPCRQLPGEGQTTHPDNSPPASHQLHSLWPRQTTGLLHTGGASGICLPQTLPLPPLRLLTSHLCVSFTVCKVLPHLPFHLRHKAVLGTGQGRDNTPFYRKGKGSSKRQGALSKVMCSARQASQKEPEGGA